MAKKVILAAAIALAAILALSTANRAEEGMWLLTNFPVEKTKAAYGFDPPAGWLDHVRLSSVRLAEGCSGSFVSADGLVLTNHHCAHPCIEQISTPKKDFVKDGFYAKTLAEEAKCPESEVDQLVGIADVTGRVLASVKGLDGAKFNEALKGEMSKIEGECAAAEDIRCDLVTLYNGGQYHLYKYRRFQDVRLVFAPEFSIAFFGGDPDNFMFPRYDLDSAFVRVYEKGKPAKVDHYFKWSAAGAREGDLTFVTGHPGSTARLDTIAELEFLRDKVLPLRLLYIAELRGVLSEFRKRSAEHGRISNATFFFVENGLKALKGRYEALIDGKFFEQKKAEEARLVKAVKANPELDKKYGTAWAEIARSQERFASLFDRYLYIEGYSRRVPLGFNSDLFMHARLLARAAEELPKPNESRLREFADANLPALRQQVSSTAPIYGELETALLAFALTKLREQLGADDPFVKFVLGKESPEEAAERVVKGTKLGDPNIRKALFDGGKAAVDASRDPMIELARKVDSEARAVRKRYEEEVESVGVKQGEMIAKARFAVYGTGAYPDATFTLRISYGSVKGWNEGGRYVDPLTKIGGAFERHTGREPFALPDSWLRAKGKLDLEVPLNLATTNDIIGGNSGSPVINRDAEIVGLIFDGNIHSLGGDYGFNESNNRAVAVHGAGIVECLDKVYGASRLIGELGPVK